MTGAHTFAQVAKCPVGYGVGRGAQGPGFERRKPWLRGACSPWACSGCRPAQSLVCPRTGPQAAAGAVWVCGQWAQSGSVDSRCRTSAKRQLRWAQWSRRKTPWKDRRPRIRAAAWAVLEGAGRKNSEGRSSTVLQFPVSSSRSNGSLLRGARAAVRRVGLLGRSRPPLPAPPPAHHGAAAAPLGEGRARAQLQAGRCAGHSLASS